MVLTVYYLSLHEGHNEGEVRAIAFSALIVGNIFLILTSLSKTRNIISVLSEKYFCISNYWDCVNFTISHDIGTSASKYF